MKWRLPRVGRVGFWLWSAASIAALALLSGLRTQAVLLPQARQLLRWGVGKQSESGDARRTPKPKPDTTREQEGVESRRPAGGISPRRGRARGRLPRAGRLTRWPKPPFGDGEA